MSGVLLMPFAGGLTILSEALGNGISHLALQGRVLRRFFSAHSTALHLLGLKPHDRHPIAYTLGLQGDLWGDVLLALDGLMDGLRRARAKVGGFPLQTLVVSSKALTFPSVQRSGSQSGLHHLALHTRGSEGLGLKVALKFKLALCYRVYRLDRGRLRHHLGRRHHWGRRLRFLLELHSPV